MQTLEKNLSIMAIILAVVISLSLISNLGITGRVVADNHCDEYYELWNNEYWFDDWSWYNNNCKNIVDPCGNGILEPGEQCDTENAVDCSLFGFTGGIMSCNECVFDTSNCVGSVEVDYNELHVCASTDCDSSQLQATQEELEYCEKLLVDMTDEYEYAASQLDELNQTYVNNCVEYADEYFDCGTSVDILELDEIVETTENEYGTSTITTRDYDSDEALVCMGNNILECNKSTVTINFNGSIINITVVEDLEDKCKIKIEYGDMGEGYESESNRYIECPINKTELPSLACPLWNCSYEGNLGHVAFGTVGTFIVLETFDLTQDCTVGQIGNEDNVSNTNTLATEVKNCSDLPQYLDSCTEYECQFIHPFTGAYMTREINGLVDGKCNYVEEMPNAGTMECNYNETMRKAVAEYYDSIKDVDYSNISFSFSLNISSGDIYNATYGEGNTILDDPLNQALNDGTCEILGYD